MSTGFPSLVLVIFDQKSRKIHCGAERTEMMTKRSKWKVLVVCFFSCSWWDEKTLVKELLLLQTANQSSLKTLTAQPTKRKAKGLQNKSLQPHKHDKMNLSCQKRTVSGVVGSWVVATNTNFTTALHYYYYFATTELNSYNLRNEIFFCKKKSKTRTMLFLAWLGSSHQDCEIKNTYI